MNDVEGLELIRQQIIRDGRSLLQYTGEASTYTPPGGEAARTRLEAAAAEQAQAIGKLIRFLQRAHTSPPVLGSFPSNYTTINFTSLAHLLPSLEQELQHSTAALEQGLARLPAGAVKELLGAYLDMKRRHLQALHVAAHVDATAEAMQPSVIPATQAQPVH